MLSRITARLRKGRARGFTLIELIVAMAVVAILAAIGISIYTGQIAQAHTHSIMQTLDEIKTGITAFQGYNASGFYPEKGTPASDAMNADNAANSATTRGSRTFRRLASTTCLPTRTCSRAGPTSRLTARPRRHTPSRRPPRAAPPI